MSTINMVPDGPAREGSAAGGATATEVVVAPTRARQTARPPTPFRDVLGGGVGLLMRGAAVATSVVAGPVMAAAVRSVQGGGGAGGAAGGGAGRMGPESSPGLLGRSGGSGSEVAVARSAGDQGWLTGVGGGDQTDLATVQSMQRESQAFNLQLLELQENVQQENRRFTTVSNVLRARHDTAKAAVSNIRG